MKKITSLSNDLVKKIKKLQQVKYREKFGLFKVENTVLVNDARSAEFLPEQILLTSEFIKNNGQLITLLQQNKIDIYEINNKINKYLSELDTPAGLVAIYNIEQDKLDLTQSVIYLNKINDPGNLGTIMRTALAFDIKNVVIDKGSVDFYNHKTIQAAKDSVFKLQLAYDSDYKLWQKIKSEMSVLAFTVTGQPLKDNDFQTKQCYLFGNESHGIDNSLLKEVDKKIKITMSDQIESLNISIASGIIMHKHFIKNK